MKNSQGKPVAFVAHCYLEFERHVDRTRAAQILIAAGMQGIEIQLLRSVRTLAFTDPETLIAAMEIINEKA